MSAIAGIMTGTSGSIMTADATTVGNAVTIMGGTTNATIVVIIEVMGNTGGIRL
jgi:hypothetical protein